MIAALNNLASALNSFAFDFSGFQSISDGLCGSLAACVCFGLLWAAIIRGI